MIGCRHKRGTQAIDPRRGLTLSFAQHPQAVANKAAWPYETDRFARNRPQILFVKCNSKRSLGSSRRSYAHQVTLRWQLGMVMHLAVSDVPAMSQRTSEKRYQKSCNRNA